MKPTMTARLRFTFQPILCGASLALVWLTSLTVIQAEEPPMGHYRSLRMPIGHAVDELDLPRFHQRTSHIGQEFRSKHFVVVSMFGPEHAEEVAAELEAVWEDTGRLADHWMDEHRDPRFGIGAVGVMIDNDPRLQQPWTPGPRPTNFGTDIYVSVAVDESFDDDALDQLRRESTKALFRVAKLDQVLPAWVQNGLANYVARRREQPGPVDRPVTLASEEVISGASLVANFRRTVADRLPQPPTDAAGDEAWVEFLLEGEDGRHVGELFEFIGEAVEDPVRQPRPTAVVGPGDGYLNLEGDVAWRPEAVLASNSSNGADADGRFRRWLADPLVGQPILRWPEDRNVSPEEARVADEMVVALKLVERFGEREASSIRPAIVYGRAGGDTTTVRPAINEFGVADGRQTTSAASDVASGGAVRGDSVISPAATQVVQLPVDLAHLAARLRDPLAPGWATIGADGELLLWTDRQRVEELTTRLANDYRFVRSEAGYRLASRLPSGEAIEVWLEPNRDQPRRPLARVEFARP
jgi:hypothetical protein